MRKAKVSNDPTNTRGRKALIALLERETQPEVAAAAGVHQSSVCYWAKGAWRPTERARRRLHAKYGDVLEPSLWLTQDELDEDKRLEAQTAGRG